VTSLTSDWQGTEARHISSLQEVAEEVAMFKVSVVVFALAVSGFMLWIAHENANFAELPRATFMKRVV
jgi:hypothetical protein